MLKYEQLVKNSSVFPTLQKEVGNLGQAYFLVSPDKIALDTLTTLFLKEIFKDIPDIENRLKEDKIIDVIKLPGQNKEKILTEDIDFLTDSVYYTPTQLDKKIYIIDFAHTMNESCQNKLLKTLEDPPPAAYFIFKSATKVGILPTILSRCRTIAVPQFDVKELGAELKNYYAYDARLELSIIASEGSITKAENLYGNPKYLSIYGLAMDFLCFAKNSSMLVNYSSKFIFYKDNIIDLIDFIQLILRDVSVYLAGAVELVGSMQAIGDIIKLSREFNLDAILKINTCLVKAKKRIKSYGNVNSIVDELLFSILEVKLKCQKL